jgi:hypothetical protein
MYTLLLKQRAAAATDAERLYLMYPSCRITLAGKAEGEQTAFFMLPVPKTSGRCRNDHQKPNSAPNRAPLYSPSPNNRSSKTAAGKLQPNKEPGRC